MADTRAQPGQALAGRRALLQRLLPPLGTALLVGYMLHSTDLPAVAAALQRADLGRVLFVIALGTVGAWLADSACLVWILRRTLPTAAQASGLGLRPLAELKAASYVLNIVNYNAATLGMAFVVARRAGVGFLEATVALAVMSWLDLVALASLLTLGLQVAPDLIAAVPGLQSRLQWIALAVMALALGSVLVLQSQAPIPGPLQRLRSWTVLRPLASLRPQAMIVGVLLRGAFVCIYVIIHHQLLQAFGLAPSLAALLVLVPVLTVVGVVPLSISGIGTTQLLARELYRGFAPAGVEAVPTIDAMTTVMIVGFIAGRLLVALPFLPAIGRELRLGPPDAQRSGAVDENPST